MKPYTPHPYQLRGIELMCREPGAALFLDPGMGKTAVTLATTVALKHHRAIDAVLVIVPLRPMFLTWPKEVATWADFSHLVVSTVTGTPKQRREAMARKADVYLINPEQVVWLASEGLDKFGTRPQMLVVDESSYFKSGQSQRFKALRELLPAFERRYVLNGTPMPQHLEDLFTQYYITDHGARLGKFITHFRKAFCWPEKIYISGGATIDKWIPKPDALEQVYQKARDITYRLKAEDYLTMPAISYNTIAVTLPEGVRDTYRKLERDLHAILKSGVAISAPGAAAAKMKLRQIVNGLVYTDAGSEVMHTAKIDALKALVEEQQGSPLLVAVAFVHEVDAIRKALGDMSIPYLGGGVSKAAAAKTEADWNAGKLPVVLAHPTSVSKGLNLQAGGHAVCWFGLTWNSEEYYQFNRRVYRQGQTHPVVIHHISVEGTVDTDITEALINKLDTQAAFMSRFETEAVQ